MLHVVESIVLGFVHETSCLQLLNYVSTNYIGVFTKLLGYHVHRTHIYVSTCYITSSIPSLLKIDVPITREKFVGQGKSI